MPTWPATLPQKLHVQQWRMTMPDGAARQDMDAGPAYQRRRFSAAPEIHRGKMWLDLTQWQTLRTFWVDELGMGAVPFDWQHPLTGAAAEVQFDTSQPPRVTGITGVQYEVTMVIEVLP